MTEEQERGLQWVTEMPPRAPSLLPEGGWHAVSQEAEPTLAFRTEVSEDMGVMKRINQKTERAGRL